MAIEQIRAGISGEVFDYVHLMHELRAYSKPRDLVSRLLRQGKIIRIRKGLYVFGDLWRRQVLSSESLAPLIYGPSVISSDYVLSRCGLIPESVYEITSVTTGRSRVFETVFGNYSYRQLSPQRFAVSIMHFRSSSGPYLMASPLKALTDKVWLDSRCRPASAKYFKAYLFEDLRVDEAVLSSIYTPAEGNEICQAYSARKIDFFYKFLHKYYG